MGENSPSFSLTQYALFISQMAVLIYTKLNTFFLQKVFNVKKIATVFLEKNPTKQLWKFHEPLEGAGIIKGTDLYIGFSHFCQPLSYRWALLGLQKANTTRSHMQTDIWCKNGIFSPPEAWVQVIQKSFTMQTLLCLHGQSEAAQFSYKNSLHFRNLWNLFFQKKMEVSVQHVRLDILKLKLSRIAGDFWNLCTDGLVLVW